MPSYLVVLLGIAAIGWVNSYFFLAERSSGSAAAGTGGIQEAHVVVQGGYQPAAVLIRAGAPARVVFERRESDSCSEEVVFPAFGIRRFLPAFQSTVVEIPAAERGQYEFTCGMSMLRGKLIAE